MINYYQALNYQKLFSHFAQKLQQQPPLQKQIILVPNITLANDLKKRLATELGISWNIESKFWNMYEWALIEGNSGTLQNFEFAPLGSATIRWKIFSFLRLHQHKIQADENHPLHFLISETTNLWHLATEFGRIFGVYLNSRSDWLNLWAKALPKLSEFIKSYEAKKIPDWLDKQHQDIYLAQHFLFNALFVKDFLEREKLREDFYEALLNGKKLRLPEKLWFFQVESFTEQQLQNLQKLGQRIEINIYQVISSPHYIEDLVDKRWWDIQNILRPQFLDEHYDFGHPLFSRFGRSERRAAKIINLCQQNIHLLENEEALPPPNLLNSLKQDLLELNEEALNSLEISEDDRSLRIFAGQDLLRQLEFFRAEIAIWLNEDSQRRLSDILLVLPDVSNNLPIINAIFPQNGEYDGYFLPTRLSGVVSGKSKQLWDSICGFYTLWETFDLRNWSAWFLLPETLQAFGINLEEGEAAIKLINQAGFRRTFDEAQLKQTLAKDDIDYRACFCIALDKLISELLEPESASQLPFSQRKIIETLCDFALEIEEIKYLLSENIDVFTALTHLQDLIKRRYSSFQQDESYFQLQKIINELHYSLHRHPTLNANEQQLPLKFILEFIEQELARLQISGEPSGAITIANIRDMRHIPFKLIIFAGADYNQFPSPKQDDRYNLRELDKPRLSDRNNQDDDLGIFFDLFKSAQENLWFSYSYIDSQDHEELLPAQTIQELLNYLQEKIPNSQHYYRIISDNPLQQNPSAPLWQEIRERQEKNFVLKNKIDLQNVPEISIAPGEQYHLNKIINAINNPATTYLFAQNIKLSNQYKELPFLENLNLNALERFQIFDKFLQQEDYQTLLPAGAAGSAWNLHLQQWNEKYLQNFLNKYKIQELSAYYKQDFKLNNHTIHTVFCPDEVQFSISAKKDRAHNLLSLWLEHLALNAQKPCRRIHAFINAEWEFNSLTLEEAKTQLNEFINLSFSMRKELFLLPSELFFAEKINDTALNNFLNFKNKFYSDENLAWKFLLQNQANIHSHLENCLNEYRQKFYDYFKQNSAKK